MMNTMEPTAERAIHAAVARPLLQPQAVAGRRVRLVAAVILGLLSILLIL